MLLPGNVAVHHIGAGVLTAFHQRREECSLVDVEQQENKHGIHRNLKQQAKEVGPPKTPPLLACVIIQRSTVFTVLETVLALSLFAVGHVEPHKERRAGDEDQLQSPESGVGDGVEMVVADVVATRLPSVAVKVLLLVAPDLLTSHQEDQESEDENNGEPEATKYCGVLVGPTEEALKESPVHAAVSPGALSNLKGKKKPQTAPRNEARDSF